MNLRQDLQLKNINAEIDFFDLLHSFWQQKKLIGLTMAIVGALAFGYVSLTQHVYRTSSVLRPAAVNELDALNRSGIYTLPAADALLKVGAALESYENRLNYFKSHQDFFKPLEKQGSTLEQSFEAFSRDAMTVSRPDPNKASELSPFIKMELIYPETLNGVEILNGFVEYAINIQRQQISADLKIIISNRLGELETKINSARSSYHVQKEGKIAALVESDKLKRATLGDELSALRMQLKIQRDARINQLNEAISIAKTLGIKHPTTPAAMADAAQGASSRLVRTEITSQGIPQYFMGSDALEAERAVLLKRTTDDFTDLRVSQVRKDMQLLEVNREVELLGKRSNEDVFLKDIEPLRAEVYRLENLHTDMSNLGLVSVDRKAQAPLDPIKPKKALIVVLGVMMGLMLGLMIATIRCLMNRRRQMI